MKLSGNGVEGIGFAMPINSSMDIINQLIEFGIVKRPYIGIKGRNITEELAKKYDYPVGIYVQEITSGTAADKAGLKIQDVIVEIEGQKVATVDELNKVKNTYKVGDEITLKIYRDKKYMDIKLTLSETEPEDSEGTLQDYYDNYDKNYNSNPFAR